jgi:hypothetical protein
MMTNRPAISMLRCTKITRARAGSIGVRSGDATMSEKGLPEPPVVRQFLASRCDQPTGLGAITNECAMPSSPLMKIQIICWLVLFSLSACRSRTATENSESRNNRQMPTWTYSLPDHKAINVTIGSHPKSDITERLFVQKQQEVLKDIERIKVEIQEESREKVRAALQDFLMEISNGEAFFTPFSLKDWPILIPSRVSRDGETEGLCVIIGRHDPKEVDVVFTIASKEHLHTSEVRKLMEQVVNSLSESGNKMWSTIPMAQNRIFDEKGNVIDPYLNKLLNDQVFIRQH